MFLAALTGMSQAVPAFGWEDPVNGEFHHQTLTRLAAERAGWSEPAWQELAWHCDWVDSYLYNPLWWAPGGLPRIKASLATGPALTKLHFDDLTSPEQILTMWRRYTSGTVAGLIWAWRLRPGGDVDAARNVVGAGLHALQDFYSHSNWVDEPARRDTTYHATAPEQRLRLPLWTGTYEQGDHLGVKPHGKPGLLCGLLKDSFVAGIERALDIACHAASPLSSGPLCKVWRDCRDSVVAHPKSVLGVPIPDKVYYLAPPGVAADSTWQADIAVQVRGLTDLTGPELFDTVKKLAIDESAQWLEHLDLVMTRLGAAEFWASVKSAPPTPSAKEKQFEDLSRLPHLFLGAGQYPPPIRELPDEWYLRVRLLTGSHPDAGTDSDIVAHAPGGPEALLDYMPRAHPLLAYDDFQPGDDQVHMLGPFPALPPWLELENRSATAQDVFVALGDAFLEAVERAARAARDLLLSLIGGPADFVGQTKKVWDPAALAAVPDNQDEEFELWIDGRSEGQFLVYGTIRRVARTQQGARSWSEYIVHLNRLHCRKESELDGVFSFADEPILFALLVNQAEGAVHRYAAGPFGNVDKGENRALDSQWGPVRVPDDSGYLTLPVQVLESDLESQSDRNRALDAFAQKVQVDVEPERAGFLDKLGAAIKPDWQLRRLEVLAFTRGQSVTVGTAYSADVDRWIRGRERVRFPLQLTDTLTAPVWPDAPPLTPDAAVALTALSAQATWEGAQLTDDSGNSRGGQRLPFNGNDGDARGFVRLVPLNLEDGARAVALETHPMWVDNGTIKGWHSDVELPPGARFRARVGFRQGASATDGVRFRVFEHHNRPDGRRVWNQVVDVHKTYTGQLLAVDVDLSALAGQPVGLELRVDAGPKAGQDWAVWVDPRIEAQAPSEPAPAPTPEPSPLDPGTSSTYVVVAGDTFNSIARRHAVTVQALIALNPQITDPARIKPGDLLTLPDRHVTPDGAHAVAPRTYRVVTGDTLNFIARRHAVTVQALISLNPQITDPAKIKPGDLLALPASRDDGER